MSTPSQGQPFLAGHVEFSLGDPAAAPGTAAYESVVIGPIGPGVDVPPQSIISLGTNPTFQLTTRLRLEAAPADFGAFNGIILGFGAVEHHITNLETGATLAVAGGAILASGAPGGDTPVPPGIMKAWYSADSFPTALVAGTYRVLTHVHAGGPFANALAAFNDSTYIMVVP